MDYGDYYSGLYRDYYRDPFPHSLLSTRQRNPGAFLLEDAFHLGNEGPGTPNSERYTLGLGFEAIDPKSCSNPHRNRN